MMFFPSEIQSIDLNSFQAFNAASFAALAKFEKAVRVL